MKKIKDEFKKAKREGFFSNKKLYIAVSACIAIFLCCIAAMMSTVGRDSVGTDTLEATPVPVPTPVPYTEVFMPPRESPTAAATATPPVRVEKPVSATTAGPDAVAVSKTVAAPDKLEAPVVGDVLNPFSINELVKSKTTGNWQVHRGVDIKADLSAAVLAAADGVVEKAYMDDLYGCTIIIDHGADFKTVYSNLSTLEMVSVGDAVKAGQAISGVGDSAAIETLEEAHLHFEVIQNGQYRNPMELIQN